MKMAALIQICILTSLTAVSCAPDKPGQDDSDVKGLLPPDGDLIKVEAKSYSAYEYNYDPSKATWAWYETLTVENMGVVPEKPDRFNKYGSWADGPTLTVTGYFHTEKYRGRWVIVDPEGKIHIDAAALTISPGGGEDNKKYFVQKFNDDRETWIFETMELLSGYGFNGSGAWGDEESIRFFNDFSKDRKCTYCPIVDPMSDYGYKLGIASHKAGNTGYEKNCIPVFNPDFVDFCREVIPEFTAKYRNDPNVLGYFTDNEMPLRLSNLEGYLSMDEGSYGRVAAETWLSRNGYSKDELNDDIRREFAGYVAETYYRIVSGVLKAADPNHMYLGSRLAGTSKTYKPVIKAAGRYCDIISINYYGQWDCRKIDIERWEEWTDCPFMITEFYTKAEDSGLANTCGDGWIVRDQKSRGLHYENFIIGLLRSKSCVGWAWCKYLDNDPTAKNPEPSNRDANKGIFDNSYEPYPELVGSMTKVNTVRYSILSQNWLYTKQQK